jgi:phosphate:Na+ symporter
VLALLMLPLYLEVLHALIDRGTLGPAESIALFHTAFNLVGVAALLPLSGRYAELLTRLVPERGPRLTRFLGQGVATIPQVAVEAARRAAVEVGATVVAVACSLLSGRRADAEERESLEAARRAIRETRGFLSGVRSSPESETEYRRHLAVLHTLDHLERLVEALEEPPDPPVLQAGSPLAGIASGASDALAEPLHWLGLGGGDDAPDLGPFSLSIAEKRRSQRPVVMALTAAGRLNPDLGLRALDAMRWIDRVAYHVWRAVHHLSGADDDSVVPLPATLQDAWEPTTAKAAGG